MDSQEGESGFNLTWAPPANARETEDDLVENRKESTRTEEVGQRFAGRAVAYVIDSVVYLVATYLTGIVGGLMLVLLLILTGHRVQFNTEMYGWINLLVSFLLFTFYFVLFEWLYGATFGKVILRMRVVRKNGDRCGLSQAVMRGLVRYIDGLFFGLVAAATMKHPFYQRYGDQAAGTIVVSTKSSVIRQRPPWWLFVVAAGLYLFLSMLIQILAAIIALR